jgi:hypothetical protein
VTLQKGSGRSEVAAEQPSGDQRGGNHLRTGLRTLGRLLVAAGLKHHNHEAVAGNHVGIHRNRERGDFRAVSSSLPDGYQRFPLTTV